MAKKLQEQVKNLPKKSGVYLFRNKDGEALYVGKAIDLRNRVQSYFQENANLGPKTQLMVNQISEIEHFETESEFTALLLEADLIKRLKPKYNQRFKDDKSYPLIEITKEKYPRVRVTRKKKENAEYFGPYPHGNIRKVLKLLRKSFPFRDCSNRKFTRYKELGRGCLFADMDLCSAPCAKEIITEEKYRKSLKKLKEFLRGKGNSVIKNLEKEMKKLSKERKYEEAAKVRDQLDNLKYVRRGFRTASTEELDINLPEDRKREELKSLKKALDMEKLPQRIEAYDISNIQGKQATGSMVVFENAQPKKSHYRKFKIRSKNEPDDVAMIKEVLERRFSRFIGKPPQSPAPGASPAAAKGSGLSTKKDSSFQSIPDLILVDGGKGQLSAALEVLQKKNLAIPTASLAKREEAVYHTNTASGEGNPDQLGKDQSQNLALGDSPPEMEIKGPINLPNNSPALQLLQRIRDESHRFALAYHRKLRTKNLE